MSDTLLLVALLPGILIIVFIFRKDKVEHEPKGLIFKLVIFGALSCAPAAFFETVIEPLGSGFAHGTLAYAVFEAFAVAALCEEVCKYFFLRIGSWNNRNFDFRFDGIVYSVSVAVGFALLENILYVADGGMAVAISRGLLAVPLHSFCGVFMGINYGAAKKYSITGERGKAFNARLRALVIPFMIHGIYDTLAFMESGIASVMLLIFVGIMYVAAIKYVNRFSREDWHAGFYNKQLSDLPLDGKN